MALGPLASKVKDLTLLTRISWTKDVTKEGKLVKYFSVLGVFRIEVQYQYNPSGSDYLTVTLTQEGVACSKTESIPDGELSSYRKMLDNAIPRTTEQVLLDDFNEYADSCLAGASTIEDEG